MKPRIEPRERILTFGVQGTGKSNAILTVAKRCPENTFYVVDNDDSYERLLAEDYPDLTNVKVEQPDDWEEHLEVIEGFSREMDADDWLVVDLLTEPWDLVQDWFTDKVFHKDIEEYFLEVRIAKQRAKAESGKDKKSLGAMDGWMDWPVINKQYRKLSKLLINRPGHLYCTAELSPITKEEDDKDIRGMFGPYGVKPKGQKRMGHMMQTVLLLGKDRAGTYTMTTVKDRGREEMEDEEYTDFAKDYLMGIAGWRP